MPDNISNISEFKRACSDFSIYFRDTDDRQRKEMLLLYKVNGITFINDKLKIYFVHSVNWCKVDIGNREDLSIHCELTTEWQTFKYDKQNLALSITGQSNKFGHKYEVIISLPQNP